VIAVRVWPVISLTILTGWLLASWSVAKVCRRSWKRIWRSPAEPSRSPKLAAAEPLRVHVVAPAIGEDEPAVGPGRTEREALVGLTSPVRPHRGGRSRRRVRLCRLGLQDLQIAVDALQRAAHLDRRPRAPGVASLDVGRRLPAGAFAVDAALAPAAAHARVPISAVEMRRQLSMRRQLQPTLPQQVLQLPPTENLGRLLGRQQHHRRLRHSTQDAPPRQRGRGVGEIDRRPAWKDATRCTQGRERTSRHVEIAGGIAGGSRPGQNSPNAAGQQTRYLRASGGLA
jgi:hypothetical protein